MSRLRKQQVRDMALSQAGPHNFLYCALKAQRRIESSKPTNRRKVKPLEIQDAPLTPQKPRRSPMFTIKVMEAIQTDKSDNLEYQRKLAQEKRKNEIWTDVKHAVKRGVIFRVHDASTRRANAASENARKAL